MRLGFVFFSLRIALAAVSFPWFFEAFALTPREQGLIEHVRISIARAENRISQLDQGVLAIDGMSSPKVRHFLNNLCSMPNTCYLEIGCWKGSTFISSLFKNGAYITSAIGIDNWSAWGGPKEEFYRNCQRFLPSNQYQFHEVDCFKIDPKKLCANPVNVYFYDGAHTKQDQELAFLHYNDVFDDLFVAVVDDWNWPPVPEGTRAAFDKLQYQILFEQIMPARWNGDEENWWHGLYIAVIRK